MKSSQKCCLLLFILFSTTIIISCCKAIYQMSLEIQQLTQEALSHCSYYLFWKFSMLAHVMYFFISIGCTIVSMQYYQDNYQDDEQAMTAIQRINANPALQKRKNILKMAFFMMQSLFVVIFGPNLLIHIIIASVNYRQITGRVCNLQQAGNPMFIYSIVGFGILSIIMTILSIAGLCSCMFMCCEWRKRLRAREQLGLNEEVNENNEDSDQENQDFQLGGDHHSNSNHNNNSPQYIPPNIEEIMSELNIEDINEIEYQYEIANMMSDSQNSSRRRSSV